ncbi:MAG TPA: type II secretion system protein, partial [Tepidisphaeraceae bacterium]|nr:type II secretion system protein [Tepidisphaeraceae bacterium]
MKRPTHDLRKGFTLLELVVVMFILLIAITFLILLLNPGPCGASKERGNRVRCARNLRQIGQALMIYAQNNKGAYPRVRYVPGASLAKFTKPQATNPFADDGPAANDVTASLFLLIRTTDLNPEVFVCPSSNQEKETFPNLAATSRSNFTSSMNLSYSFAHPYPDEATVKMGYKFAPGVVADFVIGADRNDCVDRYKGADPDTVMSANITPMNS